MAFKKLMLQAGEAANTDFFNPFVPKVRPNSPFTYLKERVKVRPKMS